MAAALGSSEPEAAAAPSAQKRCRAAEQHKRGGGQPDKRNGGWSDTRMGEELRRQGGEGDTHAHTKIRERERQGDNKGGRDHMGEGVPHLGSSTLPLSLFACPVQGRQSRASERWAERPYPRRFSCLPRFCIAVGEAVISRSVKALGVTG